MPKEAIAHRKLCRPAAALHALPPACHERAVQGRLRESAACPFSNSLHPRVRTLHNEVSLCRTPRQPQAPRGLASAPPHEPVFGGGADSSEPIAEQRGSADAGWDADSEGAGAGRGGSPSSALRCRRPCHSNHAGADLQHRACCWRQQSAWLRPDGLATVSARCPEGGRHVTWLLEPVLPQSLRPSRACVWPALRRDWTPSTCAFDNCTREP